ncbi:hypothetical protein F8G81_08815 [Arthrobacter sp. CDRTa11]|uniref:hypothetical protein n=1 Tax=Arthrobacter sp. CDRTa11 TaxID=2651199 RepID=UPI002265D5B3|nr:hypothetical protein [Arthrobacter sp. CDRTa11]UZX02704.1 hypothetical protein F8G81_08815 [Arthrobacter sp. CDRTa11]
MSALRKNLPTKGQAVFMAVMSLLWMASSAVAVLVEGRPATLFFWLVMAMNIVLFGVSVWLYRKAAKISGPSR